MWQARVDNEWLLRRAAEHRANAVGPKNPSWKDEQALQYKAAQLGLAEVYEELLGWRRLLEIPEGAAWITTYSGRRVDLAHPRVEDISIDDVAHALGGLARFTGHTSREYYTVAEHSVLGSLQMALTHPEYALEFLLHDGPEAYLGDVSGPLKAILGPVYPELERRWERVFAERYGLQTDDAALAAVKAVDERMLRCEGVALMGWSPAEWGADNELDLQYANALSMRYAGAPDHSDPQWMFLERFGALVDQRQALMLARR